MFSHSTHTPIADARYVINNGFTFFQKTLCCLSCSSFSMNLKPKVQNSIKNGLNLYVMHNSRNICLEVP
jgi:hypothetical protein